MKKKGQIGMWIIVALAIGFIAFMMFVVMPINVIKTPELKAEKVCEQMNNSKYVNHGKVNDTYYKVQCSKKINGEKVIKEYVFHKDLEI